MQYNTSNFDLYCDYCGIAGIWFDSCQRSLRKVGQSRHRHRRRRGRRGEVMGSDETWFQNTQISWDFMILSSFFAYKLNKCTELWMNFSGPVSGMNPPMLHAATHTHAVKRYWKQVVHQEPRQIETRSKESWVRKMAKRNTVHDARLWFQCLTVSHWLSVELSPGTRTPLGLTPPAQALRGPLELREVPIWSPWTATTRPSAGLRLGHLSICKWDVAFIS